MDAIAKVYNQPALLDSDVDNQPALLDTDVINQPALLDTDVRDVYAHDTHNALDNRLAHLDADMNNRTAQDVAAHDAHNNKDNNGLPRVDADDAVENQFSFLDNGHDVAPHDGCNGDHVGPDQVDLATDLF